MKKNTKVKNNKMYLIGDIGNSDVKICLFNRNMKLIKKKRLKTILLNKNYLSKNLKFIKKYKSKIKKVLISSVLPLEPVTATIGAMVNQLANSISLMTGIFLAWAC